jgi:hypothetical protein
MKKENLTDLLTTKFYSASKQTQQKLLKFLLENVSDKDMLVDFLNEKKLRNNEKHFQEGDYIYVPITVSSYPGPYKKYYEDNMLLINDLYIRTLVQHINPITGYTGLVLITDNTEIETVIDVYTSYIPNQKEIVIM